VNGPKSRRMARLARLAQKESRAAAKKQQRGGQHTVALPILMQTGRGQAKRGSVPQRGQGYDIRLDSLPGCPPLPQAGGRKTRTRKQRGQGYDIRLNSLPGCPPQSGTLGPQGGLGLSWANYPSDSTHSLRKRYMLGTKTSRRRRN
jgi:hypothetical protein